MLSIIMLNSSLGRFFLKDSSTRLFMYYFCRMELACSAALVDKNHLVLSSTPILTLYSLVIFWTPYTLKLIKYYYKLSPTGLPIKVDESICFHSCFL